MAGFCTRWIVPGAAKETTTPAHQTAAVLKNFIVRSSPDLILTEGGPNYPCDSVSRETSDYAPPPERRTVVVVVSVVFVWPWAWSHWSACSCASSFAMP